MESLLTRGKCILILLIAIVTLSFSVSAFNLTVTVQNSTFQSVQDANVTVTCVFGGCSAFAEKGPWSNVTNASGVAVVPIPVTEAQAVSVEFQTTVTILGFDSNVTEVGPSFPPMTSYDLRSRMNGNVIYTQQAANIVLSALNATGASQRIGYMIKDTTLGFPVAQNFQTAAFEHRIAVPANRNYSVMLFGLGGDGGFSSPPVSFTTTNYTAYTTPSGSIFAPFTINTTFGFTDVWGYALNHEGKLSSYEHFVDYNYFLEQGFQSSTDFVLPDLSFMRGQTGHSSSNVTKGFYNVTLVSVLNPILARNSTVGPTIVGQGFSAVVGLFANNGTTGQNGSWLGLQNVTTVFGQSAIHMNITLKNASGEWTQSPSGFDQSYSGTTMNFTTVQVIFQEFNSTGFVRNLTDVFGEYTVTYNFGNGPYTLNWLGSALGGGQYRLLLSHNDSARVKVYSKQFSPRQVTINGSLSTPQYVNQTGFSMERFRPGDEAGGGDDGVHEHFGDSDIFMAMLKNIDACNVHYPNFTACRIGSGSFDGGFDPLSLAFGGKVNIYMRTAKGTITHFIGADLLASGPPDAVMSDEPINDNSVAGSDFDQFFKFGSVAPDIYDKVYIGIPYDDATLNETNSINVTIDLLYTETGKVVWNSTVYGNGTQIPTEWSDYNVSWFNRSAGGMPCRSVPTSPCYINATNNTLWLELPHFSNVGPTVRGENIATPAAAPAAASASSSSGSGGGSGGGGGGISSSTSSKAVAKAKVTRVYGTVAAGQKTVATMNHANVPVTRVEFVAGAQSKSVTVLAASLKDQPTDVTKPKASVYEYLEIIVSNVNDLTQALVDFTVSEDWLRGSGFEKNDVTLYRWVGEWEALPTEYVSSADGVLTYSATTPGFSYFYIGVEDEKEEVEEVAEETAVQPEVVEKQVAPPPVAGEDPSQFGLWLLLAIIVLVGVGWFFMHRSDRNASFKRRKR